MYVSTPAGPIASYMAICGLTAGTMSATASMIARLNSKYATARRAAGNSDSSSMDSRTSSVNESHDLRRDQRRRRIESDDAGVLCLLNGFDQTIHAWCFLSCVCPAADGGFAGRFESAVSECG